MIDDPVNDTSNFCCCDGAFFPPPRARAAKWLCECEKQTEKITRYAREPPERPLSPEPVLQVKKYKEKEK